MEQMFCRGSKRDGAIGSTATKNDLVQLQSAVPSLGVGTDNSFSLRGVGSLNFSPNVDSSVGVAIDDVSLGVPLFMNYFGFEDVDRVEVLLGPQGLLFGRNASAGLLNVVTKRPDFAAVSGRIYGEVDYRDGTLGGSWGQIVRGTINVPVSPTAAFRLNGFYSDQDTIAKVVTRTPGADFKNYQRRFGVKGKVLAEPTDQLSIYLVGDYAQNRGIGGIYDRTLRYLAPGSVTALALAADGVTASPRNLSFGYSAPRRRAGHRHWRGQRDGQLRRHRMRSRSAISSRGAPITPRPSATSISPVSTAST
jgi:iron complex outermembrane receptor protein